MNRMACSALVLLLAAPALAQSPAPADDQTPPTAVASSAGSREEAAPAPDPQRVAPTPAVQTLGRAEPWSIRQVEIGYLAPENSTGSGKFLEYRTIPEFGAMPLVRFAGNKAFRYDFTAWNALQDTALYTLRADPGSVRVSAYYQRIPHLFGTANRSVLQNVGEGAFLLPNSQQLSSQRAIEAQYALNPAGVNYTFLSRIANDAVAATEPVDVRLLRQRGQVDLDLFRAQPLAVRLSYFQENRNGDRGSGTAFGFGNVVETAEPIQYTTRDLGVSAEWTQPWGLVRGAAHFNQFGNAFASQTFDNPFRATDSTDPSAYTAPASGSIGGPAFGRIALPPDNQAITGSVGAALKFGKKARLTADASLGQWTQDEPFIPFTSNTAITVPFPATDPSHLPAASLGGDIGVFSFSSTFNARPARNLVLNARYRRYDLQNDTPRIAFDEGYVRFDAVWEEIPRISVPYGYTTDNAVASLSYNFGPLRAEGGYKYDRWQRTYRETGETRQNTLFASANVRPADWMMLRATYERGHRTYDQYDTGRSEHASYLEAEDLANLAALRRYDQSERDSDRLISSLQLSPGGAFTVGLSYVWGHDDYSEGASYGLLDAETRAFSADVDYTPTAKVNLFAFYTREDISNFQRGRQSGATPSTNPLDDWTSDVDDQADSFGGGVNLGLVPDRLDLKLLGTYQKVDGNNDLFAPPGGAPAAARRTLGGVEGITAYDDTRFWNLNAELAYRIQGGWTVTGGAWWEDYRIEDATSVGSVNYVPGGLFLAGNDGPYAGRVFYVRLSYAW
jgi:MtrB/PioB family decaheme-associated outer membrane protein